MIWISSDHAGLELKNTLLKYLNDKRYPTTNLGTDVSKKVNYTDFAIKLCIQMLESSKDDKGILICGTGIGMSIMANRFKGIRAAVCTNEYTARMSIKHNNANVICLGSRVIGHELAKAIVDVFLCEKYDGERHKVRVKYYDLKLPKL